MSSLGVGFFCFGIILLLLALRVPIGVALGVVSFLGMAYLRGMEVAFGLLKSVPHDFVARWELSAIPMFLLMGSIAHHSGISADLFRAARLWLGRLPGGLAVATNISCAFFAAASGSSVATAAAMGRIAIPEMIRQGYDKGLATGVVASAGNLGALIPPSILFVLYGIFAEVSIVQLFIAGIFPGILTAAIYTLFIVSRCKLQPHLAPPVEIDTDWQERFQALGQIWPILTLIIGIIGGLYGGLLTATEAGAFGAFLALVISLLQRRLGLAALIDSLMEGVMMSARLFFIAIGAVLLARLMAFTGMSQYLGDLMGGGSLDPVTLIIAISVLYLVLGMFLDPLGVLLLTLPVVLPMFEALQMNLVWVGVIIVKYIEIGLLTPPVGFNVYVIKSVVGDEVKLETIFRGVAWFLACEIPIMGLLIFFPQISLFLPESMG